MAERVVAAVVLGLGLAVGGWCAGDGYVRGRAADRFVTVRGLSERYVAADLAIWPISFAVTANELPALHERLAQGTDRVRSFLTERFPGDEVRVSAPRVEDKGRYGWNPAQQGERFAAEVTVTLRTATPGALHAAIQATSVLVEQGVAVQGYGGEAQWLFTGLEQVKPPMIAEATQDARKAAEQLARDAGGTVGPIRQATQGYFSIDDRDPFSPEIKRVRVVTTVEYLLE